MIDRDTLIGFLGGVAIISISLVAGYYSSWLMSISPTLYALVVMTVVPAIVYGEDIFRILRDWLG